MKKIVKCGLYLVAAMLVTSVAHAQIILDGLNAIKKLEGALGVNTEAAKTNAATADSGEPAFNPAYSDTLRFFNGDTLHGNLVSIDPEKGVRWKTPDARGEIEFVSANLARIITTKPKVAAPPPSQSANYCLLRLSNGDELMGNLTSVDTNLLVLDTDYAGKMSFPRQRIQFIRFLKSQTSAIYEGPTSLEGWSKGSNTRSAWKYADNGFSTPRQGTLARDLKLPPLARLEFDLSWRGTLQFVCQLYSEALTEEWNNNAYALHINSGYIYLQHLRRSGGGQNLGQTEVPALRLKTKTHVEILANKDTKTISVLMDGVLIKQWRDGADWVGAGTSVLFINQNMSYLRVANVRLTEWDGKLEDTSAPVGKSKEDSAELSNKDKISGILQKIQDGKMSFATAFATMDIPVDRIYMVNFASDKMETAEKKKSDLRAHFFNRGFVTINLEKHDGKQVLASSSNFGKAAFKADAFSHFLFNLVESERKTQSSEMFGTDEGDVIIDE